MIRKKVKVRILSRPGASVTLAQRGALLGLAIFVGPKNTKQKGGKGGLH